MKSIKNKTFTFKVAEKQQNQMKAQNEAAIASGCSKISAPIPIGIDFRTDNPHTSERDDGNWC